ncbi:MAG TPA: FAD-dependent oxidoreductase [Firmicutes bacterium]|nr:FAD-dependent oxidoreductase [Bacillota bacterium]
MKTQTHFDVIVCGGGPGGIGAALGSRATGARTLLIERYGYLGGGATAMLVNPFMPYITGNKQIIHGVFERLLQALAARRAYGAPNQPTAFDPEAFKIVAERMCLEAGVDLLYHAYLASADTDAEGRISRIHLATKGGLLTLTADIFVDATGDGDLAAMTGCQVETGRPEDGLCQPMTLNFRMAGVDVERMPSRQEFTAMYIAAKERGEISCPRENILFFFSTQPGVIHFNTTRVVKLDATDSWQLTAAEIEARRQVWQLAEFFIKQVPGFENAYLQMTAPQIGVRESRRVLGKYVLTAEDCLETRKFADAIARGCYNIDIHSPTGEGTVIKRIPPGEWYEIPYRSLLPKGPGNLLIGSRCISATHEAHSAIRVMPIVMAIGQAAGVAAGLSVRGNVLPRNLPVLEIQRELLAQGQSFDKPGLDLP